MSLFKLYIILAVCFAQFSWIQAQTTDIELEKRVDELLSKLTLEEKIGQTCQITLDALLKTNEKGQIMEPNQLDPEKLKEALEFYKVGSVLNVSSHTLSMEEWRTMLASIHQPYKKGKIKVPILYGVDAIHGVNYTKNATLFPQEIGLAATWNRDLAKQFGSIVSYELRASGIPWNFSPVLDLGRQPLWSRYFETLGEDPYLATEMGVSIVNGYQGKCVSGKYNTIACLKHFVGYSYPLSGRDRTPAWISPQVLYDMYLPVFEEAIKNGALTVMINSGELNGVPGHINTELITNVLKKQWGFKGFTVSDWEDIIMLETVHKVASNQVEAIAMAFNAGLDMSMVPNNPNYKDYCSDFKKAMDAKLISQDRLDDAVRRIIRVKLLAEIDKKALYDLKDYPLFGSEEHKKAAYQSAAESITLLKNENNVLPLNKAKKILVIGDAAHDLNLQNGAWTHTWQGVEPKYNTSGAETFLQALQKEVNTIDYIKGVDLFYTNQWEDEAFDTVGLQQKASNADVLLVFVSELPSTEKPGDIRSLSISEKQNIVVQQLSQYNKPIVLVLVESRPRIVHDLVVKSSAVIQTYLPGDYGAKAFSDILFGKVNPSGKLPYTYPKYEGVIEHYDHKASEARSGKTFAFDAYDPEWDFGHGLSYSTYTYSDLMLSKQTMSYGDSIVVKVNVKNTGKMAGYETVQLYVSDIFASVPPRGKMLKDFQKIWLNVDEEKTVEFIISEKDLNFVDMSLKRVVEKGLFDIRINNLKSTIEFQ